MLAADPVIAEFQADNSSTIADEDGDWSDWIEIQNPDAQAVSLAGWYLTDDLSDLTKWRFPAVTLDAGSHLMVFASGKDRNDAAGELHTNFRLSADGESLALVRPDGSTIVHAYESYPAQYTDRSYGLAVGRDIVQFVSSETPVRTLVPDSDVLQQNWTQPDFDDELWPSGNLPAGYEQLQSGQTVREEFSQALGPEWTVDRPDGSASVVSVEGGALRLNVPLGEDLGYAERGTAPFVSRSLPGNSPADWEIITEIRQAVTDRGAAGLAVIDGATGGAAIQLEYNGRLSFRLLSATVTAGTKVGLSRDHYFLRLTRDSQTATWTGYYKLNESDDWSIVGSVSDAEGAPIVEQPLPAVYARTPSSRMSALFEFVEFVIPDQRPVYGPLIKTNLESAMHDQNSSLYVRVPFNVAGDAARFDEMTMLARFDDGFQAYINGTPVASYNVPIDATWNSSASGVFGAVNGRIPLQSFTLNDFTDLLRPGANVLAIHAMNASSDDADLFLDVSLSGAEILNQTPQYFAVPTPGATNQTPSAPPARIVGDQGLFFDSTTVELVLDSPNPRLEIRYSLDGSEPTATSALYTDPLVLTESAMLQARVFDISPTGATDPSPIVGGTFIALDNELKGHTSDIPLIVLDTIGQSVPGSSSTTLRPVNVVALEVSQATGRSSLDAGLVNFVGRGGIRDRGSSTAGQPKPNLAFETWSSAGTQDDDDEAVGLLGFAADSDWVLHAPYNFDRALIRNQIAYEMANSIGRWAPGTRAVEVYLNRRGVVDARDYAGVYVLTEKIKQGSHRVDITDISPADDREPEISGGYMWKIDREDPGEPSFTAGGVALNWVEPKGPNSRSVPESERATSQQQAWVVDYFNKFRDTTRSPDINDPEGYSKYIDVLSWVDHNLVSVLGDNVDALNLSTYLFKDRGKKIEYGPQWDFDRSMESLDDRDNDPLRWGGSGGTAFLSSNFWGPLFRDPGFWQVYVDRWTELRRGPFRDESLDAMIDKFADEVAESQERNLERWASAVRPRTSSAYNSGKLDGTWQGEVEHLRAWLHARAAFIDGNFAQPPTLWHEQSAVPVGGKQVPRGTVISIQGPQLAYYEYTDYISAEPGAVTASYFSPSDDSLATEWTQPGFDDSSWPRGPLGLGMDGSDNYTDLIQTQAAPAPDGTTILLRIPFPMGNLDQVENLVLRMRYDDGFVAYLNGTEVARRNVREPDLAWNSRATTRRNTDGVVFEDLDISQHRDLLNVGDNVLAIRLINASATSNDLFVQPALVSRKERFGIATAGDVYFTTDGTDPRGPDGNPSPSAMLAPRGHQVTINENTRIVARNFDDVTDRGTEARSVHTDWSAPVEYRFVVQSPNLRITELNYNPSEPTENEATLGFEGGDFEFVEIYNAGTTAADLRGVHLANGVEYDFYGSTITSLEAGQFVLVVANAEAFEQRYGGSLPVAGEFTGRLNDAGEMVELVDGVGTVLFSVNYGDNDRWGEAADGLGATLELMDPARLPQAAQDKWYSWHSSTRPGGTPGQAREMPPGVVINEILARTAQPDAIELYNATEQTVDIGGWYLSDSAGNLAKFPIPAGTRLGPHEYVVFDERHFNADPPRPGAQGFALNGEEGDNVWLVELDAAGNVVRFVDDVHFDAVRSGESLGRAPNGQGRLAPLQSRSLGSANGAARVGPLVISELQYNPRVADAAQAQDPTLDESMLEFIEVHNPTATAVDLARWRLAGGIDYEFGDGVTLAAGGSVVVLPFDPDDPENLRLLNAWKAQYGIDQVPWVGGYDGRLDNRDDRIVLLRPELLSPDPLVVIHTAEDEVLYDDLRPWATGADGQGGSLQRRLPVGFGNDPSSWYSAPGSPGTVRPQLPGDFDANGVVSALDIDWLAAQLRSGGNDVTLDLDGDERVTVTDHDVLVRVILGTNYGDANLDGIFNSSDLVQVFQRGHYEDAIAGNSSWSDGDWDGDGEFGTSDIVRAFQAGGYVLAGIDARLLGSDDLLALKPAGSIGLDLVVAAVDAIWELKRDV